LAVCATCLLAEAVYGLEARGGCAVPGRGPDKQGARQQRCRFSHSRPRGAVVSADQTARAGMRTPGWPSIETIWGILFQEEHPHDVLTTLDKTLIRWDAW